MSHHWEFSDAKQQFDIVVDRAIAGEPQVITKDGQEVIVVLTKEPHCANRRSEKTLLEIFRESPLVGEDIDISRYKG